MPKPGLDKRCVITDTGLHEKCLEAFSEDGSLQNGFTCRKLHHEAGDPLFRLHRAQQAEVDSNCCQRRKEGGQRGSHDSWVPGEAMLGSASTNSVSGLTFTRKQTGLGGGVGNSLEPQRISKPCLYTTLPKKNRYY